MCVCVVFVLLLVSWLVLFLFVVGFVFLGGAVTSL